MEREKNKIFLIFDRFIILFKRIFFSFSLTEKCVTLILFSVLVISGIGVLVNFQDKYLITVPRSGGTLKEGIIGTPRFINPVLASTHADKSVTNLIYSGLMTLDENGKPITNLADNYTISEDGKTYTFTLKDNIKFHDGTPIKSDDVIFTVKSIQDGRLKSPKQGNWIGVAVGKIDDKTIEFTLETPFDPFIYNMTIGILPSHIWQNTSADEFAYNQHNIEPIGSGPFYIDEIKRDRSGNPSFYVLRSFDDHVLGAPFIEKIEIYFYQNEEEAIEAISKNDIDSLFGVSNTKNISSNYKILNIDSSRAFAIYFNQSHQPTLASAGLREKLVNSIDREAIISNVLNGNGKTLYSVIPNFIYNLNTEINTEIYNQQIATEDSPVTFSVATSKVPELVAVGEFVVSKWRELGVNASLDIYESGELTQNIIRSREYDALLFGQVIGHEVDLYPYWHSSQRNDPGLNVAQYTNIDTDKWLKDLRGLNTEEEKIELLTKINNEINKDHPAVFLYTPKFTYITPKDSSISTLEFLADPSERFLLVHKWYKETDKVWPIFAN